MGLYFEHTVETLSQQKLINCLLAYCMNISSLSLPVILFTIIFHAVWNDFAMG
jgi:hypothetical protein